MQRSDAMITIVSMFIIAMMILTPTGLAISVSYTATTTSASNSISASYFTVGAYSRNEFSTSNPSQSPSSETYSSASYTPLATPFFDSIQVLYTQVGTNSYQLTGTYTLTYENCYIMISNSAGTQKDYSVYFTKTIPTEVETRYGNQMSISYTLSNHNGVMDNNPVTMRSGTVYRLSVLLTFNYS